VATETLTSNRGQILETHLTDAEAAEVVSGRLCPRLPAGDRTQAFGQSLCSDLKRYRSLFPAKRFWLHRLALDQLAHERTQAEAEAQRLQAEEEARYGKEPKNFEAVAAGRVERVAEFLARGPADRTRGTRLRIERGALTLRFQETERGRTRWPGGFLVVGVFGFARPDMPLCRIDANGWVYWSDEAKFISDLHAMLELFDNDPVGFVLENRGRADTCMFCGRDLIDSVSVELVYGPECSKFRGLPHDTKTAAIWKARREQRAMGCEAVA
jgi:hypothetical protein